MPKNKSDKPHFSEGISAICNLFDQARADYKWNGDMVVEMDGLTQDLLHSLELDGLKYEDRAKVATRLAQCRQRRREYKDTVAILEPLIQYLESEKGRQLMNLLREVLGKTRKTEERMKNRVYVPRVLWKEEYAKDEKDLVTTIRKE